MVDELQQGFRPAEWVSDVFVRLDDGTAYVSARGERLAPVADRADSFW